MEIPEACEATGRENKAAREEICKLEMSALTTWIRRSQKIGKNQNIPISVPIGSLQMALVKFN
jgi:hypothetical protein